MEGSVVQQSTTSVLIVDDDPLVTRAFGRQFRAEGFRVRTSELGLDAVEKLWEWRPDVLVTDLFLPDVDGVTVCQAACQLPKRPVIVFISGQSDPGHRVRALEAGADDFMMKPVDFRELQVRISLRRRSRVRNSKRVSFSSIEVDLMTGIAFVSGRELRLDPVQVRMLAFLVKRAGHVVTYDELRHAAGSGGDNATVRKHIQIIRSELGDLANLLRNVWGVGYCLGTDPAP